MYSTTISAGVLEVPGWVMARSGARVVYLGNATTSYSNAVMENLQTSLNNAALQCRAGLGDTIVVMPDYIENISTANQISNLVAGTRILGAGVPKSLARGTLQFTAAASTFLLNVANVEVDNLILDFAVTAATNVTAPITVSAAGCKLSRNKIHVAKSATILSTSGITVATGADDATIEDNEFWTDGAGTFATNPDRHVVVTGTVARFKFLRNVLYGATSATGKGLLEFTAAATNVLIRDNSMHQMKSDGTSCIVGIASLSGVCCYNDLAVESDGTAASQGITIPGNLKCFQNFCSDEAGKSGALAPAVVAT